jgi:hypothetical protein
MEYTFKHLKTGKIVTYDMKMSELDAFKAKHPELERYIDSPPSYIFDTKSSITKTDNTWKEVLSKVAEKHPGSPLADQYKSKTAKEAKTREVVDKYKKKMQQARGK